MNRQNPKITGFGWLTLTLALTSCAVGPDYQEPEIPMPASFSNAESSQLGINSEEAKLANWWEGFQDETLSSLVKQAIAGNKDIAMAQTRINESRAVAREALSKLIPGLGISGQYSKEQVSGARFPGSDKSGFSYEIWNGGLDVVWELDFFGRLRREREGRLAELEAAEFGLRDMQRIVAAEVALSYFDLREKQREFEITKKNVEIQEKTREIVKAKRDVGTVSDLDLARTFAQLSATRALLPPLEAQIKADIYRLAVLTGKSPEEANQELANSNKVPTFGGAAVLTEPVELLRRRPDLRATERELAAATAVVGSTIGQLYPQITFNGSLAVEAPRAGQLFDGAGTFSIAPKLLWTPFDNGTIRSRIKAADARAERALLQYQQAVLTALEETENALARFAAERSRRNDLVDSVKESNRAYELADLQYSTGSVDLLTVLDAQRQLLAQESELSRSDKNLAGAVVAIYKALGGGWEEQVPAEK